MENTSQLLMENMAVRLAAVIVHLRDLRIATPPSVTMPINTEIPVILMENMAVIVAAVIVHLWDLRIATPPSVTMPINTEKY